MITVRQFQVADANAIAQLFHDTVREVNRRDYTEAQVKAWAPDNLYFRDWVEACSNRMTYVAETNGEIVGFGELKPDGHIDCFYCHKDYQGQGVGRVLFQAIAAQAEVLQLPRLFTEASITAKPFFERMGFVVIQAQQVTVRGETFVNYKMEKQLLSG
jgi:putative acetyltransferase